MMLITNDTPTRIARFSGVKFLLFIVVLMITIFFHTLVFIMPKINEYRTKEHENINAKNHRNRVINIINQRTQMHNSFVKKNEFKLKAFASDFDVDYLFAFARKLFDELHIVRIKHGSQMGYKEYRLDGTTPKDKIYNVYKFVNRLQKYTSVIKADFPVYMESHGDKITTIIILKVYNLKTTRNLEIIPKNDL